jgi:hypothetical protein
MTVAVITSIYGGHDQLREQPPQDIEAEWICVTDKEIDTKTWNVIVEPRPAVSDRLASKMAKCCPWLYTSAKLVVWIDGPYLFKNEHGLSWLIKDADTYTIAQFNHYSRECIYDEAEVSRKLPKYSFQPVEAQMEYYRKRGYPVSNGLFGGGIIVRNFDKGGLLLRDFGKDWLMHQIRWTDQDQLSEMFVLWDHNMTVHPLPGDLLDNEALTWSGHAKPENR